MGWSNSNEDSRADYLHDLDKHDFDPLPARLAPKVTPAVRVAIEVKGCKNIQKAAELIEAYAADMVSRERLERVAAGTGK